MFPYLKTIREFISDCEKINHKFEADAGIGTYKCEELSTSNSCDYNSIRNCDKKCKECAKVPELVAWLVQNVNQANWGREKKYGVRTVEFREIRSWCQSLCVYMHDVLKPFADADKDLVIGLEYYLETRDGFMEDGKNHSRVDVMIGGYGNNQGITEKRLLVIELKQYSEVCWSDDGRKLIYNWGSDNIADESPNYQVKYYCDNIAESLKSSGISIRLFPGVFMHNLYRDKICSSSFNKNLIYNNEGFLEDSRVTYSNEPIRTFIAVNDKSDCYGTFREYINDLFDDGTSGGKALDVFKELKKGYHVLSQDELADMLVCDDLNKYINKLRPDQHFVMFGYDGNNNYWDNYLKNHIDYLYFFKIDKNREYWESRIPKQGIIDVVEGGPGSGKSVLAMLLMRYCLDRRLSVAYVYTGSAQVNKVFGVLTGRLKNKLKGRLSEEEEETVILQNLVNSIDKSKLGEFSKFKGENDNTKFAVYSINDLSEKDAKGFDVYIIDDAHNAKENYVKKNPGKSNRELIEDLQNDGKLVIMFYDYHQIIEGSGEEKSGEAMDRLKEYHSFIGDIIDSGKDRALFEEYNAFHLWSMFRCNKYEGYLTWVESMLDIDVHINDNELNLFDFDAKIIDKDTVRQLAKEVVSNNKILVLSETDNDKELKELLGQNVIIYKGKNGKMPAVNDNGAINVGKATKIRGVETETVLVIIDDQIRYENGNTTGEPTLKNRYRVLLTRGLKECYIYVMDEKLRAHMMKSLEMVLNRRK